MSARAFSLISSGCLLLLCWPLTVHSTENPTAAKMSFLRRYYAGPHSSQESNHFIDLWETQTLRSLVMAAGLTNNHALFINCHGKAAKANHGKQHVFYPHQTLAPADQDSLFTIKEFATLLGAHAVQIENVVLSSCNLEGSLNLAEIRESFPNATNIIHAPAGQAGYQPMFFQMLLTDSANVETLYERRVKSALGGVVYEITNRPHRRAKKLAPYIADLFDPGAIRPFRTQIAGRELLLVPHSLSLVSIP